MNYRFDYILSYWIFVWFLLYLYDIVPFSPHLSIILALLFEIGILFAMIYNRASIYYIGLFIIITILIKVVPLYILQNETIDYTSEFFYMVCLVAVYAGWLRINNKDAAEYFTYQMRGLASGKATTPAISIIYPYIIKFLQ
jgi:hypothetical protein